VILLPTVMMTGARLTRATLRMADGTIWAYHPSRPYWHSHGATLACSAILQP